MDEFKHILVPTDFGDAAKRAMEMAADLAKQYGGSLSVLHAYEIPLPLGAYPGVPPLPAEYSVTFRDAAQRRLDQTVADVQKRLPGTKGVLACGVPWEQILEVAAQEHATLIVMGTHGRKGLKHALLGSVAEKVVRLSPVPVLTVRAES